MQGRFTPSLDSVLQSPSTSCGTFAPANRHPKSSNSPAKECATVAKEVGPKAKVLVDSGHHYLSQNIEQIVAWLLDTEMLGGFHFNDRRYADDDLTFGSIDPYQAFRIFHEIHFYAWETWGKPSIPYMIDQSHIDNYSLKQ
jgi:L-rhamnose isomerase